MSEAGAVLVTGGAGYIGSHVVLSLLDAGLSPIVVDDLSTGARIAVPSSVPFAQGKAGDAALVGPLLAKYAIKDVIHLAGSLSVPESMENPEKYYRNNTAETLSLASTCVEGGVRRFIFSSTCAVYGQPRSSVVSEDEPIAPISPYGRSKFMTETILRDLSSVSAMRTLCLRYFNVAGADPKGRAGQRAPNSPQLIRRAVDAALGRQEILEVFGDDYPTRDGTCERDYIHVSDLAEAHLASLAYLRQGGTSEIFNCGYGRGITVREIINHLEALADAPLPVREGPRRPGDPASIVACPDRLKAATGWTARYADIDAILSSALAWQRRL